MEKYEHIELDKSEPNETHGGSLSYHGDLDEKVISHPDGDILAILYRSKRVNRNGAIITDVNYWVVPGFLESPLRSGDNGYGVPVTDIKKITDPKTKETITEILKEMDEAPVNYW